MPGKSITMKTLATALIILALAACGNDANENKGTQTAPSTADPNNTHADTMMQPNGVTNGTVTVDSTHK